MPGYTHLQRAMPSSWGLWFAAFAESFLDNADLLSNTKSWLNVNPLGTAAGYGVNLPIKRDISTKELNFKTQTEATTDFNTKHFNVALLGFKMAVNDSLTVFNLVDGVVGSLIK